LPNEFGRSIDSGPKVLANQSPTERAIRARRGARAAGSEDDDLARLLRVDQGEPTPVERERVVGRKKVIFEIPVLGNP